MDETENRSDIPAMHKRRILLEDGRYMIFFTFDGELARPLNAALADEIHAQPAQMNVLVPDWTRQTVEQIFATHLEDWPALLRSLRLVGDDVREKARRQTQASSSEVITR